MTAYSSNTYLGSTMSNDTILYKSSIDERLLTTFMEVPMGKFSLSAEELNNNTRPVISKMKKNAAFILKLDQQQGTDLSKNPRKIYYIKIKTIN